MSDSPPPSGLPPRRRWLRWILFAILLLGTLAILLAFLLTSSAFLRAVLLPRVGNAFHAEVTADDVTLRLFSSLKLRGLRVRTTGTEPVFAADEIQLRYRLRALLAGRVELEELTLIGPTLHVIEQPDGTRNVDPFFTDRPPTTDPADTPTVDLHNLTVRNGTVRWTRLDTSAGRTDIAFTGIDAALDRLANDAPGQFTVSSRLQAAVTRTEGPDRLDGRLSETGTFHLDLDLHLGFQTLVQPGTQTARLQSFTLQGRQGQRLVLEAELGRPVNLSWADGLAASDETSLTVRLNQLSLVNLQPFLRHALHAFEFPTWTATSGTLHASQVITQIGNRTTLQGTLTLADFTGDWNGYPFQNYHADSRIEAALTGTRLELKELTTDFRRGGAPGGSTQLDGAMDIERHDGQFTLSAHNLNQLALGPFLDPFFAPHHVRSITLNGTSSIFLEPDDRGRLRAQLQITNLTTGSSNQPSSVSPLSADLHLDTAWHADRHSIQLALLTLPPTPRADNRLRLTGHFDLSVIDPAPGELQLTATALDLTPFYDLFFPPTPYAITARPAPSGDPAEPDAIDPALGDLRLETRIDQLYLREILVSDLVASTTIHGAKIRVDPLSAAIHGAPFSGQLDLDLGVPGWRYDLQLDARDLPLEPLVNSFAPEYRGQYRGLLQANAALQGQGITTSGLQQHLDGRVDVTFTNAQIQIVAPKIQRILVPIATLLRLPQLTDSPLDWVRLESRIAGGQIHLDELALQSSAFQASTSGAIPIQSDTHLATLNLPLRFHLRRSLAGRASLLPPNTPPDVAYVSLPDFATVRGTVRDPKTELNPGAITSLLIRSGVGIAEQRGLKLDEPASRLLRSLGDVLGGLPLPGLPPAPAPVPDANLPPATPVPAP